MSPTDTARWRLMYHKLRIRTCGVPCFSCRVCSMGRARGQVCTYARVHCHSRIGRRVRVDACVCECSRECYKKERDAWAHTLLQSRVREMAQAPCVCITVRKWTRRTFEGGLGFLTWSVVGSTCPRHAPLLFVVGCAWQVPLGGRATSTCKGKPRCKRQPTRARVGRSGLACVCGLAASRRHARATCLALPPQHSRQPVRQASARRRAPIAPALASPSHDTLGNTFALRTTILPIHASTTVASPADVVHTLVCI